MKKRTLPARFIYILFSLMLTAITSCSTDEPDPVPSEPESEGYNYEGTLSDEEFAEIKSQVRTIREVIDSSSTNDIDNLMRQFKRLEIVKEVEYDSADSTIVVVMEKGYSVRVLMQRFEPIESLSESFYSKLESKSDSISSLFEEFDNQTMPAEASIQNVISRAGVNPSPLLRKRNILLIAPDPTLRKEDIRLLGNIKEIVNANSEVGKFSLDYDSIGSYTPTYFRKMASYDFVYIGCHGTPEGRLIFPLSGMNKELEAKYTRYALNSKESGVAFNMLLEDDIYDGFVLSEKFFNNCFPDLSSTLIWTSKCYSGSNMSELRLSCISRKHALNYYGADGEHTGDEAANIFSSYLTFMSKGIDSYDAFWESEKRGVYSKPLKRCYYKSSEAIHVKYPLPQATGVKSTASRGESDFAEPVVVGARFRYSNDENGNPLFTASGGIKVTNLNTGNITYIPLTSENTSIDQSHRIGDHIVISDFDVTLSELIPGEDYSYCSYLEDEGVRVESAESFTFKAPDLLTCYDIYTEKDFMFVLHAGEKIKRARLMNDIFINEELFWESLYSDLEGNNHLISFCGSVSKYDFEIKGNWRNVNISFSYSPSEYMHCQFSISETASVNDCTINNVGTTFPIITNYGTIKNSFFKNSYIYNNIGVLDNCKFIGAIDYNKHASDQANLIGWNNGTITNCVIEDLRTIDSTNSEYPATFVGNNQSIIENCHIISGEDVMFCVCNEGSIINCSIKGILSKPYNSYNSVISVNSKSGKIDGFKSYINFDYRNSALSFHGIITQNSGIIKNVDNHGSIKAFRQGIAICGYNTLGGNIENCTNYGKIEVWSYCPECTQWDSYDTIEIGCVSNFGGKANSITNSGSYTFHENCFKHSYSGFPITLLTKKIQNIINHDQIIDNL